MAMVLEELAAAAGGIDLLHLVDLIIAQKQEIALTIDDLLGLLAALDDLLRFSGDGIENMYRTLKIKGHEDPVVPGDQPERQACRSRPEAAQLVHPALHGSLPENHTVEGIASDQGPPRLEPDVHRRSLIDDVEHAAPVGHCGAEAGRLLVRSREPGISDPLDVTRRPDELVPGDRVIVRPVQEMGPVIDLIRPRLDLTFPLPAVFNEQNPLGHQHPHHLGEIQPSRFAADDQVDKVVRVGELLPAPGLYGDASVAPERLDLPASRGDKLSVLLEPVNHPAAGFAKRRGQAAIPTARMNHQAAPDSALGYNFFNQGMDGFAFGGG